MGFLNFVEEHHGIRLAAHLFRELPAFLVTDVARRRADHAGGVVTLHVFGHVELDERLGIAEHGFGERLGQQCFAHAGRPQQSERADGALGILQVGARAAERLADGTDGFALADDALRHLRFHREQTLGFALFHALERDAGPFGDDVENVFLVHLDALFLAVGFPRAEDGFHLLLRMLLLVAHGGGALEVLFLDGLFFLRLDLLDLALDVLQLGRAGHGADAGARTGLIHQVDGLVWEKAVGDVAIRHVDRGDDGAVGDLGLVMFLVLRAQALEDGDGVIDGRSLDSHALEAAFERGVLLDVFAILVERGGADALHLAAAERGLDDVAGVHRALRGTGTDDGVQFVDEEDDVLRAADFIHDRLDAFLELAAILRARDHEGEVKRDDALLAQQFRDVALGDFLRETFDDGGLAHAGFSEQHRVILGAAAENLDDALDLVEPADDGIHLAFAGDLGQVAAKSLERRRLHFALLFGGRFLRRFRAGAFLLRVEIRIEFLEDLLAGLLDVHVEVLKHAGGDAVAFAQQAEQDVLGADVGVVERLGFLGGEGEHLLHAGRVGDVADHLLIGSGANLFLDLHADGFEVKAHLLEHVDRDALAKFDQPEQQVLGADKVVVESIRFFARQREHLLRPGREVVHGFITHN